MGSPGGRIVSKLDSLHNCGMARSNWCTIDPWMTQIWTAQVQRACFSINTVSPLYPRVFHPWSQPTTTENSIFSSQLWIHSCEGPTVVKFLESIVIHRFLMAWGVSAPNPHVVQKSTVLQSIQGTQDGSDSNNCFFLTERSNNSIYYNEKYFKTNLDPLLFYYFSLNVAFLLLIVKHKIVLSHCF